MKYSPVAFGLSLLVWSVSAQADVKHTIARGHTLEAIAGRYHVSVRAIMEANALKDGKHLKPGAVLTIPGVDAPASKKDAAKKDAAKKDAAKKTKTEGKDPKVDAAANKAKEEAAKKKGHGYVQKPKAPGVVHLVRPGLKEDVAIRIADKRGRVVLGAPKQIASVLRSQATGALHAIDRRLARLVAMVSDHFGGRTIHVVSGYRPYSPKQYTKSSNHNHGRAIDFRVSGVPNEVVRDYCRTLKNTGCGYYPNSTFVHMDARKSPVYWIDYSKAGEAPRYQTPNAEADEGTSDVHAESGEPLPTDADEVLVTEERVALTAAERAGEKAAEKASQWPAERMPSLPAP